MKRLYSARNPIDAQQLRLLLEAQGIRVELDGESNAFGNDFYFSEQSRPGIYVGDADWEHAESLLREYQSTSAIRSDVREWRCEQCGESVPWQFDECWKCANAKTDIAQPISRREGDLAMQSDEEAEDPEHSNATPPYSLPVLNAHERRDAWIEVGAVLSIAWLPFFHSAVEGWLYPQLNTTRSFALDAVSTIIMSFSVTAIVLFVMYRSNLPWRAYGITKPKLMVDTALGILIWASVIVGDLSFLAAAGKFFGYDAVYDFTTSTYEFEPALSTWDRILFVPMCIAIGISEEIAMRGYLIPRFEQLLGSVWSAVAVSAVIFASCHIYQGIGSVLAVLVTGLVLGTAFALSRRLWPVALAHAITDLIPVG